MGYAPYFVKDYHLGIDLHIFEVCKYLYRTRSVLSAGGQDKRLKLSLVPSVKWRRNSTGGWKFLSMHFPEPREVFGNRFRNNVEPRR